MDPRLRGHDAELSEADERPVEQRGRGRLMRAGTKARGERFLQQNVEEALMLRTKLLAAFAMTLCTYAAAQTPQKPEAPDPTPPPRGTMSFPPVTGVEQQPLTPAIFVARAAIANLKEIEAGQLALKKSEDPAVKALSQQMIDAHRAAQEELKTVAAQQQHLSVPAAIDEKNKKDLQELSKLDGKAFDRKYLETLSADHDKAVALFDAARQTSELPVDLKSYASEALASTQDHRKTVQKLQAAE